MKKAQTPIIKLIGAMILIIIIIQIASTVDVDYSIQLRESEIQQGTDAILSYSIYNGLFQDIHDVNFYYNVNDEPELSQGINIIRMRQSFGFKFDIRTSHLPRGEHLIKTRIEYRQDSELRGKELLLKLTVL